MRAREGVIRGGGLVLALAGLFAVPGGCFRQRRATTSVNESGYLAFRGRGTGATFTVTSDERTVYERQPIADPNRVYSLDPGAYRLTVERDGVAVVRRKILLTEGQTVEVSVP